MTFVADPVDASHDDYAAIFSQRGQEYHRGMRTYPGARATEFRTAVAALQPRAGDRILDAPAGGGYLRYFLPEGTQLQLIEVEPAQAFCLQGAEAPATHQGPLSRSTIAAALESMPLQGGTFDAAVSVAGLHHAGNLPAIFREFGRLLKPQGRLVIMEVEEGSTVDRFLNEFVDTYSSAGHSGRFVDRVFRQQLVESGFKVTQDELKHYTWAFTSSHAMVRFAQLIFGIDLADERVIIDGIGDILGFNQNPSGCDMNWGLRLVMAENNRDCSTAQEET